jgi:cyclase
VKGGFDVEMLDAIASVTSIPIIASGGAGNIQHFIDLFKACPRVDAGLAASIFHLKEVAIGDLKNAMAERGIPARRLQYV